MRYNPRTHHRRSVRLPAHDYAQDGAYFVTICTHERQCILEDARFNAIAERAWREIVSPPPNADASDFVIMPNHVHGIVWIGAGAGVGAQQQQRRYTRIHPGGESSPYSGERYGGVAAPLQRRAIARPVVRGSLAAIVRTFKSATAKRINNLRGTPGAPVWQRNYHEHVIRNDEDLSRIRQYIGDNPRKWAEDPDNPGRLLVAGGRGEAP